MFCDNLKNGLIWRSLNMLMQDAFSKILGAPPSKAPRHTLKAAWLETKLGLMVAIADDNGLYWLKFADRRESEREVEQRLREQLKAAIIPGETFILKQIKQELNQYFSGKRMVFETPIYVIGSPFQKKVWEALRKIPPGETRSYADIARLINEPKAFRAVARTNGANPLAIVIPCHRVINSNGEIGGYNGGITRKQWLLDHEKGVGPLH